MAYQLKPDESIDKGVRRVWRREVEKALERLETDPRGDDEIVHSVRKRIKKLRALLRLVRPELGKKAYQRENAHLRDASRPLTELRDARVLVGALDKISPQFRDASSPEDVVAVRTFLLNHRESVTHRVVDENEACSEVRRALEGVDGWLSRWKVNGDAWVVLDTGLERVYKAGYRALTVASIEPSVENLHEWRKQAKYFWHQLQLLAPFSRNLMSELGDNAHELTRVLGDDHDLAMLDKLVLERAGDIGNDGAVSRLKDVIDRRRIDLQKSAFDLGRRIYRDGPRATMDRMRNWRGAWQRAAVEERARQMA